MDWNVPAGNQIGIDLDTAWFVPPGNQVGVDFAVESDTVSPSGWDGLQFGTTAVTQHTGQFIADAGAGDQTSFGLQVVAGGPMVVATVGSFFGQIGSPALRLHTRYVLPTGFMAVRLGRPSIRNFHQEVAPSGLNAFRGFGAHWVSLGTRRIYPTLGVQTRWGTHALTGGVRWLDLAGRGIAPSPFGTAFVAYGERQVFPAGWTAILWGNHRVDHDHPVDPEGWDSLEMGEHEVHTPRILLDIPGFNAGAMGWPLVQNWIQEVRPAGWMQGGATEPERFGRPEAYNLTQYLFQLDEPAAGDGGVFGNFTYVENRNKVARPEGWASSRFGMAEVFNNARIITTLPFQEFTLWGDQLVADANRELGPQGWDSFTLGHWLTVHNDAFVIGPAGWDSLEMGRPDPVWSNQQTTKPAHWDSQVFGVPMVAFRIREVSPFPLPPPPPFGAATVQHMQRYVVPPGLDAWRHGLATVEERFTIIAAKSVLPPVNQVGDGGRVWNLTPELRVYGWTATVWGAARVFNQFERYEFQGFDAIAFGRHVVRDRRFWVTPNAIAPMPISVLHRIQNVDPDPPATRTIGAAPIVPGQTPGWAWMGNPSVRANRIAPEGEVFVRWGSPKVVSMGIMPEGITPPFSNNGTQFGTALLPASQYVVPTSITGNLGEPRISPHYIWAPRGYPYTTGKESERGELMDNRFASGWNNPVRPFFGRPVVTLRNRVVRPAGWAASSTSDSHRVSPNPQMLSLSGTRFQRFGFPFLGDGVGLEANGFDMAMFGRHRVVEIDTGPKTARPSGIAPGGFGQHRVEHFHREVRPQGWVEFRVSPPRQPEWPRTSHWIAHEYPPFEFSGAVHTLWGDAWVSHYTRHLEPVGEDTALVNEYTPGQFALRMRVWKRNYIRDVSVGDGEAFGMAWVEQGQRAIAPGTIRPGAVARPQVIGLGSVAPAGFDASLFGDVQRWEAGKIKPHGDDLAEYGRAVIARALGPIGFGGAVGIPGIGRPVSPAGWDASGLGDPVAVANWCSSRAMAVQGAEMAKFGETTVST